MKTPTPFWPLLKNELLFLWRRPQALFIVLVFWTIGVTLPLQLLRCSERNIELLFVSGILQIFGFMFLFFLTILVVYATMPGCRQLLPVDFSSPDNGLGQSLGFLEFYFTRAVNRRLLFRANAMTIYLVTVAPLFICLAAAPFVKDINYLRVADAAKNEAYLKAFPTMGQAGSSAIILPHGTVLYAAWVVWGGTAAFLLLQGYGALVAKRVNPNNKWTVLFPCLPSLLLLISFLLRAHMAGNWPLALGEESFLFFAAHPVMMVASLGVIAVVLQTWCERRFSQLEVL